MRVEGVALVVEGDNVDTDVMYPGAYLNVEDPDQMAQYLFEGFDPTLRDRLVDGTILVVGSNFGIGSPREHVPLAMKGSGIRGVVGRNFARIFYRNCVNLGLAIVACPPAVDAARDGSRIVIDTTGSVEVEGATFDAPAAPTARARGWGRRWSRGLHGVADRRLGSLSGRGSRGSRPWGCRNSIRGVTEAVGGHWCRTPRAAAARRHAEGRAIAACRRSASFRPRRAAGRALPRNPPPCRGGTCRLPLR